MKHAHVRGIIATTRAEGLIQRLGSRLDHARWTYNHSRASLQRLKWTDQDQRTFRELTRSDISELTAALKGLDRLGDGYTQMPWYWRVKLSANDEDGDTVTVSGKAVNTEYAESECHHQTFSSPPF